MQSGHPYPDNVIPFPRLSLALRRLDRAAGDLGRSITRLSGTNSNLTRVEASLHEALLLLGVARARLEGEAERARDIARDAEMLQREQQDP